MSGVIGWMVGSGTINAATKKTAPLVTGGMGFYKRFLDLIGWTTGWESVGQMSGRVIVERLAPAGRGIIERYGTFGTATIRRDV